MMEAISFQSGRATTTAKFKNPNRRNVNMLIRVKMHKSYQYQCLSSICSGEQKSAVLVYYGLHLKSVVRFSGSQFFL